MLDWVLLKEEHAISVLKKDHEKVKGLFERFEKSDSALEKEKLIGEGLRELKMHALIEEISSTRAFGNMSAQRR
jgi:hypothetical protein